MREKKRRFELYSIYNHTGMEKHLERSFLPIYLLLGLLSLGLLSAVQLCLFLSGLRRDPVVQLSNSAGLSGGVSSLALFSVCAVELVCYLLWRGRARAAAERGEFLRTPDTSPVQWLMLWAALLSFVCWFLSWTLSGVPALRLYSVLSLAYIVILVLAVNGTREFLKRKKAPAGVNRAVTLTVDLVLACAMMGLIGFIVLHTGGSSSPRARGTPPLTLEDLADLPDAAYTTQYRMESSLLLGQDTLRQYPKWNVEHWERLPSLDYTIIEVRLPTLYSLCRDSLMKNIRRFGTYQAIDAAPWRAEEAYQMVSDYGANDRFLLCYRGRMAEIRLNWSPTAEQIEIMARRLNP